jgi:hypothetical protein
VNDLNDIKLVETWKAKDEWDFNSFGNFHGTPSPGGGRSDDQRRQVVSSKGLVQSRFLFLKGMCHVVCFEKFSCVKRRCHTVGLIVGCRGRREVC